MLSALAFLNRWPRTPALRNSPLPSRAEVERRRQALREAVLGFTGSEPAAGARTELARRGYELRVDDITDRGVSGWAPVNTWALHPRPRREVWMVHRDRDDPWWSDTHIFATLDNTTLLAATLMPTRLPAPDEALMLKTEFSLVRYQADYAEVQRENARARHDGLVPAFWSRPSLWFIPREGWLPARDASSVAGALADLVTGMIDTLEGAASSEAGLRPRRGDGAHEASAR